MSPVLLLSAADVGRALPPAACIAAVEDAFGRLAGGGVPAPAVLGMPAGGGGFHIKAGLLDDDRPYFAAKVNANFPGNAGRGLPTIQGVVCLCDAATGSPLAVMDSGAITALRTAAATAVAAKYLAREDCEAALICGCGAQAPAQLRALLAVRRPGRIYGYDLEPSRVAALAGEFGVVPAKDLEAAASASRIIITCTTARRAFLAPEMVEPGTFVAAVGADSEAKQEIDPRLMAAARVVTDLTVQAAAIGDLHHALAAGAMTRDDVHAELGEVVAGRKPGRTRDDDIFVFDSTGTGLQDVAAAIAAWRGAGALRAGTSFNLSEGAMT